MEKMSHESKSNNEASRLETRETYAKRRRAVALVGVVAIATLAIGLEHGVDALGNKITENDYTKYSCVQDGVHQVSPGDTLWSITNEAKANGQIPDKLSNDTAINIVQEANDGKDVVNLKPGDKVEIPQCDTK